MRETCQICLYEYHTSAISGKKLRVCEYCRSDSARDFHDCTFGQRENKSEPIENKSTKKKKEKTYWVSGG